MSEEEKKIEMEEEWEKTEMIDHWSHEHPLTLVDTRDLEYCYGCEVQFGSGEQAYGCSIDGCEYSNLLHQECAAVAREIRRPSHHPQHILIQRHEPDLVRCDVCERFIWSISYRCTSSGCGFQMHLRCAHDSDLIDASTRDVDEQRRAIIRHPSHPRHDLKLLRGRCPSKCDACGATRKGSSYTCTADDCQYWIHEKCASCHYLLHHPSFCLLNYCCTITYASPSIGKDVVCLPTNDVVEELLTPFVMRQRGGETLIPPIIIIPAAAAIDELVNVKYKFLHHQHQLTLVSFGDRSQEEEEEEEDEENYGVRSELICDACITPISSSSNYYMSCSECKYNLHLACFHLPPQLSSLPPHHQRDDRQLVLQSLDKHQPWTQEFCSVCRYPMNGLFYSCRECEFKVDIKCACMPDTIHHEAHPQHLLNHVAEDDLRRDYENSRRLLCASCDLNAFYYDCYRCFNSSCDFIVHIRCVVLPASVTSRRWDERHPLLLTYDATLNRPGDFYCDQCETQMNPRIWMYRCRTCDLSFHPKCFKTTSGWNRNRKLGQEYEVNAETHPHPLTFQLLTTKRRCDICDQDRHEDRGFYCALCNFFICLYWCGENMIINGDMKAVG